MDDETIKQIIKEHMISDKELEKSLEDWLIRGKGIVKVDLDPDGNLRTTRIDESEMVKQVEDAGTKDFGL